MRSAQVVILPCESVLKSSTNGPESFKLSAEDIKSIIAEVDPQIIKDIKQVQSNVRTFAEAQKAALKDFELEIQPGVFLGQKNIPIQNVGA